MSYAKVILAGVQLGVFMGLFAYIVKRWNLGSVPLVAIVLLVSGVVITIYKSQENFISQLTPRTDVLVALVFLLLLFASSNALANISIFSRIAEAVNSTTTNPGVVVSIINGVGVLVLYLGGLLFMGYRFSLTQLVSILLITIGATTLRRGF